VDGILNSHDFNRSNLTLTFFVAVSIFGLLLSIFFVVRPSSLEDDFAFRNLTVGSAFVAVCILGIFAAMNPSSCLAVPQFGKSSEHDGRTSKLHETTFRAHHPSCKSYSTHILHIGNREFCATCSGLLFGATVGLTGAIIYFFGNLRFEEPYPMVLVGACAVIFGLLQSALPRLSNGFARFFASAVFVVGSFLVLASVDQATKNTSIDFFFVALSVLWILTKISFSQRDHQRICSQCAIESCRWDKKGYIKD
jgi:hypothetical protein